VLTKATKQASFAGEPRVLYLAFELSSGQWKLAFTVGWGQKARLRSIPAGDLGKLGREIELARGRFRLPAETRVLSCFEAGRDGFWLHRHLTAIGVENRVIDAASVEVNRRARRAKTDRLDAELLLAKLVRFDQGETRVWSVVRVPTLEQEDRRHRQRERDCRKKERTRSINRIKGLLATVGVCAGKAAALGRLDLSQVRQWDGQALPPGLRERLAGELAALERIDERLAELDRPLEKTAPELPAEVQDTYLRLKRLRSVGPVTAEVLVQEVLWRPWTNRRQAGSLVGLTPSPRQSGDLRREQGISKAGLKRVRTVLIELAWSWVRLQPRSDITLWYQRRFAQAGARLRRVGIVAVARKLFIALWRYADTGQCPLGAELKARA
jgi:transposase